MSHKLGLLFLLLCVSGCTSHPAEEIINYKVRYEELCQQLDERVTLPIFFSVDEQTYEALFHELAGGPAVGLGQGQFWHFGIGYGINFVKVTKENGLVLGRIYTDEDLNLKVGDVGVWHVKASAGFCNE